MKCQIKNCRGEGSVVYLGKEVCELHFGKHCEGDFNLKDRTRYKQ